MNAPIHFLAVLLVIPMMSCTPVGGFPDNNVQNTSSATAPLARITFPDSATTSEPLTAEQQRELRERRAALGNRTVGNGSQNNTSGRVGPDLGNRVVERAEEETNTRPLPPLDLNYRYAVPVPGRPGWVYNPWTNSPVNVSGAASGYLVYDEKDPANRNSDGTLKPVSEMPHKFRVP